MAGFTNPMSSGPLHWMGSPTGEQAGWRNPMRPGILGLTGAFSGGITVTVYYYRLLRAVEHMIFVQSEATAARRRVWLYLVDAADGLTPETSEGGGQPQVSKNGAAWANTTATLTAVGNGTYYVELTAAELDTLGKGFVRYKSANTAEFSQPFDVVLPDMYGVPNVNATQISGDSTAADNLELFFDGTGYAAANSTVGTVTTVTNMVTANTIQVSGSAPAADVLELFALALDVATGQIDSGTFQTGAITATTIATDAIGGDELAASAVAEIVNALWDELTSESRTAGSYGQLLIDNVNATVSSRSSHSAADVWTVATRTITGLTAPALADFFDTDSGTTYAASVAGSVVREIVNSVAAGTETILHQGTAQGGGANTITLDSGASATDDHYQNTIIAITSGTGSAQSAIIDSYNGTTKVATVTDTWAIQPDATSVFKIFPMGKINTVGVAGSGALTTTIHAQDAGANPIDGVAVWLTSDEAGLNVLHGPVFTDAMGDAVFHLDAGTYYSFKNLGGWNFTNPQQHEVS